MIHGSSSSVVDVELDAIAKKMRTDSLKVLLNHWRAIRGPLLMPSRRQVDPTEFASVLTRVWLCDYERETDRFRYRLTGEKVAKRFGHKLSRHYLDDNTDPDYYPRVHRYYRNVVDFGAVLYIYGRLYAETANPIHGERILLPLSEDSRTVQSILGVTAEVLASNGDSGRFLPEFQKHSYITLETGAVVEETLPV
ncbi:PAS domain-containing protein [Nisaea acidiphila]|uniref:PAS domain-containing protein n=1 Tax=Nisaea acidiphila TaxID=1862145 RepID=A0A9J7AT71_9PROT|nr:PAS domain-containing protein [Nisaea acidiphila]UUX49532.1 PAS domain-containing protein [Nisaea acidiphila]